MMQADESCELYRFLAQNKGLRLRGASGSCSFPAGQSLSTETALPSPHDRALAALKNHKEAEKRRRERINSHLDKLRTLLPCNSKVM